MGEGTKSNISRRDFTRKAVAAAAITAPALSANAMLAAQSATLSSGQAEVDATITAVIEKYGNRLTDAQKLDIRRIVTDNHKSLEAMRSFPLTNADQPGNVLKIYPDGTNSAATRHSDAEAK